MRDFAWARIVLRIVGVYFVVTSLPGLSYAAMNPFGRVFGSSTFSRNTWYLDTAIFGAGAIPTVVGLYLLFGGRRVFQLCTRDLHNCCIHCGYTFKGLTGKTCPECGTERPIENIAQTPLPPPAAERSN